MRGRRRAALLALTIPAGAALFMFLVGTRDRGGPRVHVPPPPPLDTMDVAQAVVVNVDVEIGPAPIPPLAQALESLERRCVPDDGRGRTFAILQASGEESRGESGEARLRLTLHLSTEKAGLGSLVYRPTGQVLWQARIRSGQNPGGRPAGLSIFVDAGAGRQLVVDGSAGPPSLLDAIIRGADRPLRDVWPDGAEREVTFIYSACGCPVKVPVLRTGERLVRTGPQPIIFPDDPAALEVILRLTGW